jgi:hypothetical protein
MKKEIVEQILDYKKIVKILKKKEWSFSNLELIPKFLDENIKIFENYFAKNNYVIGYDLTDWQGEEKSFYYEILIQDWNFNKYIEEIYETMKNWCV